MANSVRIAATMDDGASPKLRNIRSEADKLANSSSVKSGFGLGIGAGIAMKGIGLLDSAVGSAFSVIGDSTQKASALNETVSKVGVVFGQDAGKVLAWGDNAATAMGMSKQAALEAAGTYGNLFVSMGMASGKSGEMSTNLVGLAGDLASFNNADPSEVLEAIRSGLVGEAEPMRKFGVNISEATLQAKALEMGLWNGQGALSASAKAQAAYGLMLEQTKTAQGDFARTHDGLANQQRIAAAQVADAEAKIGTVFMQIGQVAVPIFAQGLTAAMAGLDQLAVAFKPMFDTITAFIGGFTGAGGSATGFGSSMSGVGRIVDKVMKAIKSIVSSVTTIISAIWKNFGAEITSVVQGFAKYIEEVISATLEIISGIFEVFAGIFSGDWEKVWKGIQSIFSGIWNGIGAFMRLWVETLMPNIIKAAQKVIEGAIRFAFQGVANIIGGIWSGITGALDTLLVKPITGAFENVVSFITGLPGKIATAASGMFDGIWGAFKGAINTIIDAWNGLEFKLPSVNMGPLGTYGGFTLGTPDLPRLHSGGIVPGTPGQEVLAILQAGERVTPAGKSAGNTYNITVNNPIAEPAGLSIQQSLLMLPFAG